VNRAQLKKALDAIAANDKHVAAALEQVGYPKPRRQPPGFAALVETIVNQQLSAKVGATIIGRVHALLPEFTPEALLALPDGALREAGLSGRKVEYARGVAEAVVEGRFSPEALKRMDDEQAIRSLTALRGLGRWSAEIYLMFCLGRPDVFPADDLALQVALQRLKNMRARPTAKKAREKVRHWAPWRTAGSLFLWHYHHRMPPGGPS
jgi:DNA-3-methyladenine glycosylase II